MNSTPSSPPTCGACHREALTAPCARGCGRLAVVCGCADVLSLDGACAVCARSPRAAVDVDVIVSPPSGAGGLRRLTPSKASRAKPVRPK